MKTTTTEWEHTDPTHAMNFDGKHPFYKACQFTSGNKNHNTFNILLLCCAITESSSGERAAMAVTVWQELAI